MKDLKPEDLRVGVIPAEQPWLSSVGIWVKHLPTGLVAECQDHRSQHRNLESAKARLVEKLQEANHAE